LSEENEDAYLIIHSMHLKGSLGYHRFQTNQPEVIV